MNMNHYSIWFRTLDHSEHEKYALVKIIEDFETTSTFSVGDKIFDANSHEFTIVKVTHYLEWDYGISGEISGGTHPIEVHCVADSLTQKEAEKFDDWNY